MRSRWVGALTLLTAASLVAPQAVAKQSPEEAATTAYCATFVHQKFTLTPFSTVTRGLQAVAKRDAYESLAAYQARVAAANRGDQPVYVVPVTSDHKPTYDPDRQRLEIYDLDFGFGQGSFPYWLSEATAQKGDGDSFSAIGFELDDRVVRTEMVEEGNAFGARVNVKREFHERDNVWSKPGTIGQSAFVGARAYAPLANLALTPDAARDFLEHGTIALVLKPKAPFLADDSNIVPAKIDRPSEIVTHKNILVADVSCALMLNGSGIVFAQFAIK